MSHLSGPTWAVIVDRDHASTEAVRVAVAAQSISPAEVVVTGSPADAVGKAREASAAWVWLLDGRAIPAPDALAELQHAAAAWPDDRLALLSSQLVGTDGRPLAAEAPLPQTLDPDLAAQAFEHHTYSLRVAGYGSLLIRTGSLRDALPPPGGIGAELIWSARLLRHGVGLLVPRSLAAATPAEHSRLLAAWARLLTSDALARHEKPWASYIYFNRAVALITGSARGRRPRAARPTTLSR